MHIKGRNPAQIADIFAARTTKCFRRFWLPLRRTALLPSERSWLDHPVASRWFLNESDAREILSRHPGEHAQILAEAQLAASGWAEVPGFGQRRITLIAKDQQSEAEAYAHRLLCRLDFLRPLCRAALIAEDASPYVNALEGYLLDWNRARRRKQSWDTVDDSIRILNLFEALALLKEHLNKEAIKCALFDIIDAAWNIEINRTRTGNHLIYESLALMATGFSLYSYPRARHWFRLGQAILEKQMLRQVLPDGFNAELCTNYHLITGTNFLKGWILSHKSGSQMTSRYLRRLGKMALVAAQLQARAGGFLALGDSDRMAGKSREEREAQAFAVFGQSLQRLQDPASTQNYSGDPELDWLLAGTDSHALGGLSQVDSNDLQACGGYHIWRGSGGKLIVFDTGDFGLPGASHHGHADTLSFEVHLKGTKFLVDPGGFSYVDHKARAFARSTAAHNAVRIDGSNSSEITGSFAFGRAAQVRCLETRVMDRGILLVGEHDGYAPIIHRRALFWMPDEALRLIVRDQILGAGNHLIETFFHAYAGWKAQFEREDRLIWTHEKSRVAQLIRCSTNWQINVAEGQTEPEWQGWVSPAFGEYVSAPTLIVECKGELPLEIVSVFCEVTGEQLNISLDGASCLIRLGEKMIKWDWTEDLPLIEVH